MPTPKKIAVLGGGMGSLSTVWYLTSRPDWQQYYDIDVYQMGWRVGGKGASGREIGAADRIKEHGIHMMFGFYDNALALLRDLYTELDRPADAPLATFDQAFLGHGVITLTDEYASDPANPWWVLPVVWPGGQGVDAVHPGVRPAGAAPASLPTLLLRLVQRVIVGRDSPIPPGIMTDAKTVGGAVNHWVSSDSTPITHAEWSAGWPDSPLPDRHALMERVLAQGGAADNPLGSLLEILVQALAALSQGEDPPAGMPRTHTAIADLIAVVQALLDIALFFAFRGSNDFIRRVLMLCSLGLAVARGSLESFPNIWRPDWFSLDALNFEDWLLLYGCHPKVADSCLTLVLREVGFARNTGAGAGTTLHWALRMALDFEGSFMYKMASGMGDVIFAPLYQVLKKRGVNFHFFHRVDAVHCADGAITSIDMGIQVTPKGDSYEPLVPIPQSGHPANQPLPVWPDRPLFDQLEQGAELQACMAVDSVWADLENWWTNWTDKGGSKTLTAGVDFDYAVLGISVAMLGEICEELCNDVDNPAFGEMVQAVATTQTRAFQFWMSPSTRDLGFTAGSDWDILNGGFSPVVGTYDASFDTWADMSQVIATENWPAFDGDGNPAPTSVAYWCGAMPDNPAKGDAPWPARGPSRYLDQQLARCKGDLYAWTSRRGAPVWPKATLPVPQGGPTEGQGPGPADVHKDALDLSLLVPPPTPPVMKPDPVAVCTSVAPPQPGPVAVTTAHILKERADKLHTQYLRVPYNPSERYVLSVPGSVSKRLTAWQSGYRNLLLAGDWTLTPVSAGCIEATVQSGAMCAQALAGEPAVIQDYWLFQRPPPPLIWTPPLPGQEPNKIAPLGNALPVPPYTAYSATVPVFVLPADLATLTAEVDRQLNLAGSELVFRPIGPIVLFVAASIEIFSTAEPVGTSPEKDFGFWIPVFQGRMDGDTFVAESFAVFLPLLWVDPPLAVRAGREIFGYQKSAGRLSQPDKPGDPLAWQVDGYVIPTYGPQTSGPGTVPGPESEYRWAPIVQVTSGADQDWWSHIQALTQFAEDGLGELEEVLEGKLAGSFSLIEQLVREVGGLQFPMVYLKQIDSISSAQKACYQAITWSQNNVVSGLQIAPMHGPTTLRTWRYDSADVATALGLPVDSNGQLDVLVAATLVFDFVVEPGMELYRVGSDTVVKPPGV